MSYMSTHKLSFLVVLMISISAATALAEETPIPNMVYQPVPVGSVKPDGWLKDWAQTAANGITGHLDERTATFAKGWSGEDFDAGGVEAKGTNWPLEQSSYWLDGLVRLAYMLEDPVLIAKAKSRLDPIVDGVLAGGESFIYWMPKDVLHNGGFMPEFNSWAHHHMGRALIAYYQASGDQRILDALLKVYRDYPLPEQFTWGILNVDPMIDLYRLTGDKQVYDQLMTIFNKPFLAQSVANWRAGENMYYGHTVVYYEMLRTPALAYAMTGNKDMLDAYYGSLKWHDETQLLPVGLSSGEEYQAGIGCTRNIETCDIPAAQWNYQWLLRITGQSDFGDRIEKIFFNAGPVPVSRDFETSTYYQCQNRVNMTLPAEQFPPVLPGGESYRFSELGPILCCIGNLNRVIPTYIGHMWMTSKDDGLVAMLYGPCTLNTKIKNDTSVTINCKTTYPFEETIRMEVDPEKSVNFPLHLRIPLWCEKPSVKINGQAVAANIDSGYCTIERTWKKGDIVELTMPMKARVLHGRETPFPDNPYFTGPTSRKLAKLKNVYLKNPYASVQYGPLLFALPIPDISPNEAGSAAYNYALDLDPEKLSDQVEVIRGPMPEHWHWQLDAPLQLSVRAKQFNWFWPDEFQPLPMEPVQQGEEAKINLVPYGCTKFRISMFPVTTEMWNALQ